MRPFTLLLIMLSAAGCASLPVAAAKPSVDGPAIIRAVDQFGPDVDVAAYVRIINPAAEPDRLIAISCTCATRAEMHNTFDSAMHVLSHIEIPPGGATEIKPGGATHLMLMGMREGLKPGDRVRITLTFERAGPIEAEFTGVENSRAGWDASPRAPAS